MPPKMPPKMQTRAGQEHHNNKPNNNNSINNYFQNNNGRKGSVTTTDEKLEIILNRINEQTSEIRELATQLNDYKSIVRNTVIEEIESREQHWSTEKESILSRLDYLELREENRAKQDKRNNVVIRGIHLKTNDRKLEISNFFKDKLDIEVNVKDVSTIRTPKGSQLTIVKTSSFEEKKLVMQNREKLDDGPISITSDRTKKERETQANLNRMAEELKKEGKTVSVGFRKLIVDGVVEILDKNDRLVRARPSTLSPTRSQREKRNNSPKNFGSRSSNLDKSPQ
ncbi:hypothetical protein QAD02_018962 [Eretmocerus hayati]|uniref:Uncharacterized protein n=1 Tax=Eretmocerus hayati TaxID=131215 RepID=A0ACC2PHU0_9HYME|nr:hypothetical protein QAD02_018962 [Eretmocerus hayati]